jgi:hypothetical protein
MSVAGRGKVKTVADFIQLNYPYTRIGTDHHLGHGDDFRLNLGHVHDQVNQRECLVKMLDGVDLVFNATAEIGISQMLSDMCKESGVPMITVASRSGGWGGEVVRIRAESDSPCYLCYLKAREEGNICPPPYDPKGDSLQPVGCGDVTFEAASFDVETIALAGVRLAVSTLCEMEDSGYPSMRHDVGILSTRNVGGALFPCWTGYSLGRNSSCPNCS